MVTAAWVQLLDINVQWLELLYWLAHAVSSASEPRGNTVKGFNKLYLNAKA